jgi:LL-diaminopimelate aminotransferase
MFEPSQRLQSLTSYAFAAVQEKVDELKAAGITPIDFGVGDPIDPTPKFIREATQKAVDDFASGGYPSYVGRQDFREAIAEYMRLRFGTTLDPNTEITSTVGSKEGVFNFPEAILNPGDVVLIPSPGYPPYKRGTLFAEGTPYFYPLTAENNFFPDFNSFPANILAKAKILWLCYPNNPTGALATREFYEEAIAFAKQHDLIIASDECYTDIYLTPESEAPISILEVLGDNYTDTNVITFHSLSKRSNMTGYRIGWVAGDQNLVAAFKKLKTNIDSGTPDFVQSAAIAALGEEEHVKVQRNLYRHRAEVLTEAFAAIGLEPAKPQGAFYLWQRVPEGMTSVEFAEKLLAPEIAMVVTPGAWITDECIDPVTAEPFNPGEGYVRFALVPSLEQTKQAAERLKANF